MSKPTPSFDAFFEQFRAALPVDVLGLKEDLDKNLKVGLAHSFQRMNLVTREEFDVQTAVLARTREKLEALEARVEALEAQSNKEAAETATHQNDA